MMKPNDRDIQILNIFLYLFFYNAYMNKILSDIEYYKNIDFMHFYLVFLIFVIKRKDKKNLFLTSKNK